MRVYESEDSGKYQYICSAHDDIREWAEQIHLLTEKIVDVVGIAKDMGISMETCINVRKSTIEELQEEINELKKEINKLKTAAKRKVAKKKEVK